MAEILKKAKDLEDSLVKFEQIHATESWRQMISPISYNSKPLVVVTPTLIMSDQPFQAGENLFFDLLIPNKKGSEDFFELIEQLDAINVQKVHQNSFQWYQQEMLPLSIVERDYIQTLKNSVTHPGHQKIVLENKKDQIEMYNQDDQPLAPEEIKKGTQIRALITLESIQKERNHLWANWKLLQIKAHIVHKFQSCQLEDQETCLEGGELIDENDY